MNISTAVSVTDVLMVIITVIYVFATILICVFNAKSAKAAREQTHEMQKQFQSTYRPKIDIRFDIIRSGLMCFIIENIGTEPAVDVEIKLCQEFIDNTGREKEKLEELTNAKLYIASKQKVTICLGGQPDFSKIASVPAKFLINYNETYHEETVIDLNQYGFMIVYNSPIEDINNNIKIIKDTQIKFQKDFLKQNVELSRVPLNVLVRTATSEDELKFQVYKEVCKLQKGNLKAISDATELSIEETHRYLNELLSVDKLTGVYQSVNPSIMDEETIWFRKI